MVKGISKIAAGLAVASLAMAPAAGAYKIPGVPGSSGGPPTKAKGGTGTSKNAANKVAVALAGYTPGELASIGKFTVKVHFPKAGKISCTAKSNGTKLGSGSAKAKRAGNKRLTLRFSTAGTAFLILHNGQDITIKVSCKFTPKKGKSSTSTATVVTR